MFENLACDESDDQWLGTVSGLNYILQARKAFSNGADNVSDNDSGNKVCTV